MIKRTIFIICSFLVISVSISAKAAYADNSPNISDYFSKLIKFSSLKSLEKKVSNLNTISYLNYTDTGIENYTFYKNYNQDVIWLGIGKSLCFSYQTANDCDSQTLDSIFSGKPHVDKYSLDAYFMLKVKTNTLISESTYNFSWTEDLQSIHFLIKFNF